MRKARSPQSLPDKSKLPLIPLVGTVLFPTMVTTITVGRRSTILAAEIAVETHGHALVLTPRDAHNQDPQDLPAVGTVARVLILKRLRGGHMTILLEGVHRAKWASIRDEEDPRQVSTELLLFTGSLDETQVQPLVANVSELFGQWRQQRSEMGPLPELPQGQGEPGTLADLVAATLDRPAEEKQTLLEVLDPADRLRQVAKWLADDLDTSTIQREIVDRAEEEIKRQNRLFQLRIVSDLVQKELDELVANSGGYQFGSAAPPSVISIREIHARLSERVVGQERAKRALSVGIFRHLERLRLARGGLDGLPKENILLIGPTGTGKTLLVQTLAEHVGVPYVIADATTFSETGYVGEDVENLLTSLVKAAKNDISHAQTGIIFLDEIDKIARKEVRTRRDISGEGVQRGLLRMLEGGVVRFDPAHKNKNPGAPMQEIDTKHILFICAGAFEQLDEMIRRRLSRSGVLFAESSAETDALDTVDGIRQQVTDDDLIEFGLLPEFIGRFPSFGVLSFLDKTALVEILQKPKYGVLAEEERYFRALGIDLVFDDDAIESAAERALLMSGGARALRKLVKDRLRDVLFELSDRHDVRTCRVTRGTIVNGDMPLLTAGDKSQILMGVDDESPTTPDPVESRRRTKKRKGTA